MIDIHCHMAFKDIFPSFFIEGIKKTIFTSIDYQKIDANTVKIVDTIVNNLLSDKSGKKIIQQMNDASIDKVVLLIADLFYGTPEDKNGEKIKWIHKYHYELMNKYPDRFIVFAGIDPRRGQTGLELFKTAIEEYNFKGLKLYPPCGFEINDKLLEPYYEICALYNLPVLIHTGPSLENMYLSHNSEEAIKYVAKKYSTVNFILAHSGILYINDGIKLAKHFSNIYLDISGFQKESGNLQEFQNKINRLFSEIPDKVLYGSDWPLYNLNVNHSMWINYIKKNSNLTNNNLDLLFNKNAQKLLNIKVT